MAGVKLMLPGGVKIEFELIPAGEFLMGTRRESDWEEPVHIVRITKPYYLGTYPVTQEQFAVFRPEHENHFSDRPNHPAENMTWHEAVAFCDWLTETCADSMPRDHLAMLPSEAQWEYACRAGTETEYYSGEGEAALAEVGWYYGNAEGTTQPVGRLKPNAFGLYDMHGNVDEWCRDAFDADAYKRRVDGICDPFTDGDDETDRVVRGGSWASGPGTAAPRIAAGGGRRAASGSGASGSAWSPVRAQSVQERSREAEARQGGTTQPSRSVTAKRAADVLLTLPSGGSRGTSGEGSGSE